MEKILLTCVLTAFIFTGCSSSEESAKQAQIDKESQAKTEEQQKLSEELQNDMRFHGTVPEIDLNMKINEVDINSDKAILKMVGLPVVDKEKGTDTKYSPMTSYWFQKDLQNHLEIDLSKNFIHVWWHYNEKDPKKVNEMFLLGQRVTRSLLGDAEGPQFYMDLTQAKEEIKEVQLSNGIVIQNARCFDTLCRYEIVRN